MREKDIRRGAVYGVAGRWDDEPQPAVLLEDRPRTMFIRRGERIERDSVQGGRASVGDAAGTSARGYAALAGPAGLLGSADCGLELERLRNGQEPSQPGTRWMLVTRAAKVLGPYEDAIRAYEEKHARITENAEARREEVDAAISMLAGHGAGPVTPGYHDGTVTLPAAQVARLLRADAGEETPVTRRRPGDAGYEEAHCHYCGQDIVIPGDGDGEWQVPGAGDDDDRTCCVESPDGRHTPDMIRADGSTIEETERQAIEWAALDEKTRAAFDRAAGIAARDPADETADAMRMLHDGILALVPAPERGRAEDQLSDLLHLAADDLPDGARTGIVRQALAVGAGRAGGPPDDDAGRRVPRPHPGRGAARDVRGGPGR